jgi:hypothetical protein
MNNLIKPKRSKEEELVLLKRVKNNKTRCYYCNKEIDIDKEKCSTEYGIFFACGECFPKWGNPDDDILE